jgi:diaminopimelate dehydrogenase
MTIKVAILGYGNLGRGVECAIKKNPDMELVAIFTRRKPSDLKVNSNAQVVSVQEIEAWQNKVDVLIICGGSATDLPEQTPKYAKLFNVVDSFDTHAKIPEHFENVNISASKNNKTAIISVGWDPGMFSLNRLYASAILPDGKDYTFWGKGVSQGHSDAIRRIEGVADAKQYTIPVEDALAAVRMGTNPELTTREKHKRECFVVLKEGADSKKIEQEISAALKKEKIHFELSGRVKSAYSLHKKLAKHNQNINEIYDLIALRIIVDDVTDCYLTLGVIHSLYKPMGGRIKDYIAMPKQNGYQSMHTTVITKDKRVVEFQIRTREMHEYAERGLAASFYYNEQKLTENYKKGKIEHLPTNLLWITELQMTAAKLREGKKVDLKKLKLNLFADKIFVYTPKGDIIDLPAGALPLDFAYRLHSEIGDHVVGVKINGKMSNLNKKLEQGDIVEILTSKNQTPKSSWLDKIFTSHARHKLLHRLNSSSTTAQTKPSKKHKPKK